jgi:hypothetical protein
LATHLSLHLLFKAMLSGTFSQQRLTAVAFSALALLFGASDAVHAQTPGAEHPSAQDEEIAHTVQDGDTLEGLAKMYLSSSHQWKELQARNKVADPRRLKPGSVIQIPVRLQPAESATVAFVHGTVTAQGGATGTVSDALAKGSRLEEGTSLQVGPDSFVAVRLADGTVVRVLAQSEMQLRQLRRRGRMGSVQSVLEMRSGAVEASVPPSTEPLRKMEIRTPLAVTSVRGTKFSVVMTDPGDTTASVWDGNVAVQPRQGMKSTLDRPTSTLNAGQGLAVSANGEVGKPRALLAAPDVSGMPQVLTDASILSINVPPVAGAVRYVAVIAHDAEFTEVVRLGTFADGQLRWKTMEDGRYHLSVRAVDEAGIGGIPAVHPFVVKARPVAPLYQAPAAGAVVPSGSGELQCTPVEGVRWYRLQIATDAQFSSVVRDEQRLNDCRVALGALPPGSYHWRAASVLELSGGQADQGPFAPPQSFTVAERPAAISMDAMEARDGDTTVQLRWPMQPGQRFRLQLANQGDPVFGNVVEDVVLEKSAWTASDLPAGNYLVRIRTLDASGLQSDFSPARQIRVGTGFSTGSGLPVSTSSGDPVRRP